MNSWDSAASHNSFFKLEPLWYLWHWCHSHLKVVIVNQNEEGVESKYISSGCVFNHSLTLTKSNHTTTRSLYSPLVLSLANRQEFCSLYRPLRGFETTKSRLSYFSWRSTTHLDNLERKMRWNLSWSFNQNKLGLSETMLTKWNGEISFIKILKN